MSMFGLPAQAQPGLINQVIEHSLAMSLMPKDPTIEALKKDILKDKAVARIETYRSVIRTIESIWESKSKDILKACGDNTDHEDYKRAHKAHTDEVGTWLECIKSEQSVLK